MKKINKNTMRNFILSIFAILITADLISAAPVIRQGAGVNAAIIQATVEQFRTDLGGAET